MQRDADRQTPQLPMAELPEDAAERVGERRVKPFLPMMDVAEYVQYKTRPQVRPALPFMGGKPWVAGATQLAPPPRPLSRRRVLQ